MPARTLNNSPARCCDVPTPADPNVSAPGCAFASATSSVTDFTGTLLLRARMLGVTHSCEIGTKSLTGSKPIFSYKLRLVTMVEEAPSSSV